MIFTFAVLSGALSAASFVYWLMRTHYDGSQFLPATLISSLALCCGSAATTMALTGGY